VLRELHISGLGVVDDLDLELHPGLNILSGETGAGKTMITVGLALALGSRASASLVGEEAGSLRVQARFDALPDDAMGGDVEEWSEDGELLLSRTVTADGRGTARVSGQLATVSTLADLGRRLVEVHGQHQAQRLLASATQTAFLDRFAGDEHLVALVAYRECHERFRAIGRELEGLREDSRNREREIDLLAYQVDEIEGVGPSAGETERSVALEGRLAHVERLLELVGEAETWLAGDDTGAVEALAAASRAMEQAGVLDPQARPLTDRAGSLATEASELAHDIRDHRDSLIADPDQLQQVRERLVALRALQRKYGEADEDVIAFRERAAARLEELSGSDERLEQLTIELDGARDELAKRAAIVRAGREAVVEPLALAIAAELHELGMPDAVVEVAMEPVEPPGPSGGERVELLFAGGSNQRLGPLGKTASGGELSRAMLACRSVLADLDEIPTLVFDEVDAGIGGRAGLAVGRRLASLARDRQVLVVTHLPQIACFADRHVLVTKEDGVARAQVLDDDARTGELSRMLAGMDRSRGALSHAEELLAQAATTKAAMVTT
jgi:DNA repair protein RecN (Recombination protein N)